MCDDDFETSCWSGDIKWCCSKSLVCGETPNSCLDSDGFCEYQVRDMTFDWEAECIYEILPIATYEKEAECWYTIPTLTTNDVLTLNIGKGCDPNQYCSLKFEDANCLSKISANKTGIVYGVCSDLNANDHACRILPTSAAQNVMKEIKKCSNNRYCVLKYSDTTCQENAPANHMGRIYGSCMNKNENNTTCIRKTSNLDNVLKPIVSCPESQYCYLNYKSKGCTEPVSATGANPLFGICLDKSTNRLVCPDTK